MKKINLKEQKKSYNTREAIRTLRTNLQFCGSDKQVIMVTSCVPGEGKSSLSLALAESLAELGKSVVLIDADMRKSVMVARIESGEVEQGLSHFLSGQCNLSDVIVATNTPKFHMLFSGPEAPNPTELLESKRFTGMLESMKNVYDYIIIDCPPLGMVIDAAVVGRQSDGAIIVVEAGKTKYRLVQNVKEQLENAGISVLGVVLNKVERKNQKNYYNKYYGSYKYEGYYGHSEKTENAKNA